jgi:hypothetical protein
MGGLGSGEWHRWQTKETTETQHAVDVRYLHRNGLLEPGRTFRLSWSRNGQATGNIGGATGADQIVLYYRSRSAGQQEWEEVREAVQLDWTACHYGGRRPWFLCPGRSCGRRVAVLYGTGKYFLCRHCYRLTYAARNMDAADRAREKVQKIRKRLGGSECLMIPFPERPKGMHLDTYHRLFMEAHEADMASSAAMQERIDKLGAWIEKQKRKADEKGQ